MRFARIPTCPKSSCDRYGVFAAGEVDGAVRAMLTLSGGPQSLRLSSGVVRAGGNTAAPAKALIFIVTIGLPAAMAIPAFQKVHQTAEAHVCLNNLR